MSDAEENDRKIVELPESKADNNESVGVRPPSDKDTHTNSTDVFGVRPPTTTSSQDITQDPYYLKSLGPNDPEKNPWNEELQSIRNHPGGSRQALADEMGWHGPGDRDDEHSPPNEDTLSNSTDVSGIRLPNEQSNIGDDDLFGVRPPTTRSSQDITQDPYYLKPLGPNDPEADRWNKELQEIRNHPGGSRQALADEMGWHGPEDRDDEHSPPNEDTLSNNTDVSGIRLPNEQSNIGDDDLSGVRPPTTRSSQDITQDPYYLKPLGPNDPEADRWNKELQEIRNHPGGSRQALADEMGWHGPEDRDDDTPGQHTTDQTRVDEASEDNATTGVDKADNRIQPIDINDKEAIAHKIANGHAFDKHKSEFINIQTMKDFETIVCDTLEHNDPKEIGNGRCAYWNDEHKAIVIIDPHHHDLGTMFKPKTGKKYYNDL